ncbi:MAG TPA: hypothetical protein V6C65_29415 [Allocoleopsis sp.]
MLPPVIDEEDFFPFKFWFNNSIQDGMYYRNELYYRLHTADINQRARLYHYACKMAHYDTVVVTACDRTCSIWISLRSPSTKTIGSRKRNLPSFSEFLADSPPQPGAS